jgi:Leucine-rich repeat (LRR) protein
VQPDWPYAQAFAAPRDPLQPTLATLECDAVMQGSAQALPDACESLPPACYPTLRLTARAAVGFGADGLRRVQQLTGAQDVRLEGPGWSTPLVGMALAGLGDGVRRVAAAGLNLGTIRADDLPSSLSHVEALSLADNGLRSIAPGAFRGFAGLQRLDLADNSLDHFDNGTFAGPTSLRRLCLEGNQLRKLEARAMLGLLDLEALNLQNNLLSNFALPGVPMPHLAALSLRKNTIVKLDPAALQLLPALQALDLDDNYLSQLPATLLQASPGLVRLRVSNNPLRSVPEHFLASSPNLQTLVLDGTALQALSALQLPSGPTSALQELSVNGAKLATLAPATFDAQTRLVTLSLAGNALSALPDGLLAHCPALQHVDLSRNGQLNRLPGALLRPAGDLRALRMANLQLTQLPADFLAASLPRLSLADLSGNRLSLLPTAFFQALTAVTYLDLSYNQLQQLPEAGGLAHCGAMPPTLSELRLGKNQLAALPANLLQCTSNLTLLFADGNHLAHLPSGFFHAAPLITQLDLSGNQIGTLDAALFASLGRLRSLRLSNNRFTALPATLLAQNEMLEDLDLSANRLGTLPETFLSAQARLLYFDAADNRIETLPEGLFRGLDILIRVQITGNRLPTLPEGLFHGLGNLTELYFGFNRLPTLPGGIFRDLQHLERLAMSYNQLRELHPEVLQPLVDLVHMDLSANQLSRVDFPPSMGSIICLNVSSNPDLTRLALVRVDDLVVSDTRLPFLPSFCVSMGSRYFVAQGMSAAHGWNAEEVVGRCLGGPGGLDLSRNEWLRAPSQLAIMTQAWFPINLTEVKPGYEVVGRDGQWRRPVALPQLILGGLPLQCALVTGTARSTYGTGAVFDFVSAVSYDCACSPSYTGGDHGNCELETAWMDNVGHVILVVLLTLATVALLMHFFRRIRRRWLNVHVDLQMKERLLADAEGEVMALKRAWEIEYNDMRLLSRIDNASPGAFGAVWRADWDGMLVAVKIMHMSMVEQGGSLVSDFESEADFLMHTRHPNLVRFFGLGRTPDQAPFLVLELVPRGSLSALLAKAYPKHCPLLPWIRRLTIAADVARGMAFIHSLGQLHRDLKGGNVLVTDAWRGKVADFGSIRSLLRKRRDEDVVSGPGAKSLVLGDEDLGLTSGVGTPLYMSPEVIEGGAYGKGADLWWVWVWERGGRRWQGFLFFRSRGWALQFFHLPFRRPSHLFSLFNPPLGATAFYCGSSCRPGIRT